MTAIIPELDTIEHLDFDVNCTQQPCDRSAKWTMHSHVIACGCRYIHILCDKCRQQFYEYLEVTTVTGLKCSKCELGVDGFGRVRDFVIIDRIEPIR